MISANPDPISCLTGSTITFQLANTSETLVKGDITISTGWMFGTDDDPSDGSINIVAKGDGSEIGVTSVTITVAKDAVMNAACGTCEQRCNAGDLYCRSRAGNSC